jgi:hypothetical protein
MGAIATINLNIINYLFHLGMLAPPLIAQRPGASQ